MNDPKILKVRNVAQQVMFEQEFSGQISDGWWENSRPNDHWRVWSQAVVMVDPNEQGRNFFPMKDNYSLSSKAVLDIIGDRMLTFVNMALLCPGLNDSGLSHWPETLSEWQRMQNSNDNYYVQKVRALVDAGLTDEIMEKAVRHEVYTQKEMKKDIADLKVAMKTYNPFL